MSNHSITLAADWLRRCEVFVTGGDIDALKLGDSQARRFLVSEGGERFELQVRHVPRSSAEAFTLPAEDERQATDAEVLGILAQGFLGSLPGKVMTSGAAADRADELPAAVVAMLHADTLLEGMVKGLEDAFKQRGISWDREQMVEHAEDRKALLRVRAILVNAVEKAVGPNLGEEEVERAPKFEAVRAKIDALPIGECFTVDDLFPSATRNERVEISRRLRSCVGGDFGGYRLVKQAGARRVTFRKVGLVAAEERHSTSEPHAARADHNEAGGVCWCGSDKEAGDLRERGDGHEPGCVGNTRGGAR